MAGLDDVRAICATLPEVGERPAYGRPAWRVAGSQAFVWSRPFSKADIARDGEPPAGDLLGVRLADLGQRAALLEAEPDLFLTIEHFAEHAIVLLRLAEVTPERLREVIVEAWFTCAPPELAARHTDLR